MNDKSKIWLDRYEAVGRAQHRYLFLLLLFSAFFIALDYKLRDDPAFSTKSPTIPYLDLDVSVYVVFAFGPIILTLLVLALIGALKAAGSALGNLKKGSAKSLLSEAYDRVPNLIDFIVYTKQPPPRWLLRVILSTYPTAMTAGGALAVYCAVRFALMSESGALKWIVLIASGALWIPMAIGLKQVWSSKMSKATQK